MLQCKLELSRIIGVCRVIGEKIAKEIYGNCCVFLESEMKFFVVFIYALLLSSLLYKCTKLNEVNRHRNMKCTPTTIVKVARTCCLCVTCSDTFYETESAKQLAVEGSVVIVDGGWEHNLTFQVLDTIWFTDYSYLYRISRAPLLQLLKYTNARKIHRSTNISVYSYQGLAPQQCCSKSYFPVE